MATTVRDLINGSLRLLGVLASGEEPSPSEAQDSLYALNSMLGTWRTKRLMVYAVLPTSFPFVAGKKSYTIGTGGDWNMERPVRISQVQLTYTNTNPLPLNLPVQILTLEQYQQIVVPDTSSTIPQTCYIDDNFPLRTISFYTVPSEVYSVKLFCWKRIDDFPDINQEIELPDGYERALRFNLAVDLANEFGKSVKQETMQRAIEAKAEIAALNTPVELMECDSAILGNRGGSFNWLTGGFGRGV